MCATRFRRGRDADSHSVINLVGILAESGAQPSMQCSGGRRDGRQAAAAVGARWCISRRRRRRGLAVAYARAKAREKASGGAPLGHHHAAVRGVSAGGSVHNRLRALESLLRYRLIAAIEPNYNRHVGDVATAIADAVDGKASRERPMSLAARSPDHARDHRNHPRYHRPPADAGTLPFGLAKIQALFLQFPRRAETDARIRSSCCGPTMWVSARPRRPA